ncbi:hypothetical protein [Yinghuangia seranimata]|uniref:hypothetical protein n=1 Tax=Yinghuangia seranimata TaxID=408067 RepID=UPI00248B2D28|nr:hypothetical protein [Yinghuangia seranimata]MDI2130310.1 hypothetical protein [Yinghuangia seranimata]
MNPAALLLEQAPDALFAPVLARLDAATRQAALGGHEAPGPRLVAHVLDRGEARERAVLAGNLGLRPGEFAALADTARPEVAARMLVNRRAPREALLRVLPVAPPFAAMVEAAAGDYDTHGLQTCVAVCVDAPDPDLVRDALAHLDTATNALAHHAVTMRGCLALLDAEGPDAVLEALASVPAPSSQREVVEPSDAVAAALAEPTRRELLVEALAHETGMETLLRRLRYESAHDSFDDYMRDPRRYDDGTFALLLASPRSPLDWNAVLREHRRVPYSRHAKAALARQAGCPSELAAERPEPPNRRPLAQRLRPGAARRQLFELMAPRPEPRPEPPPDRPPFAQRLRPGAARRRLVDLIAAEPESSQTPKHQVVTAYGNGLLSAREVLDRAHGAYAALLVLARARGARLAEARAELAATTRGKLGTEADAWIVALTLLPEFAGTVDELLDTARVAAGAGDGRT